MLQHFVLKVVCGSKISCTIFRGHFSVAAMVYSLETAAVRKTQEAELAEMKMLSDEDGQD